MHLPRERRRQCRKSYGWRGPLTAWACAVVGKQGGGEEKASVQDACGRRWHSKGPLRGTPGKICDGLGRSFTSKSVAVASVEVAAVEMSQSQRRAGGWCCEVLKYPRVLSTYVNWYLRTQIPYSTAGNRCLEVAVQLPGGTPLG